MGHVLYKLSPEEDFYVYFSTIVDGPMAWGTKAELWDMTDFGEELHDQERWARADANGESWVYGGPGWHKEIRHMNYGMIPVEKYKDFLAVYEEFGEVPEDDPRLLGFVVPFEN